MKHSLPPLFKSKTYEGKPRMLLKPGSEHTVYRDMVKSRAEHLNSAYHILYLGNLRDEYDLLFQQTAAAQHAEEVDKAYFQFLDSARIKHGTEVDRILEAYRVMKTLGW